MLENGGRLATLPEVVAVVGLAAASFYNCRARGILAPVRHRVIGKSKYRSKASEDERRNSVASFVEIVDCKDMTEISHDDAEAFRAH